MFLIILVYLFLQILQKFVKLLKFLLALPFPACLVLFPPLWVLEGFARSAIPSGRETPFGFRFGLSGFPKGRSEGSLPLPFGNREYFPPKEVPLCSLRSPKGERPLASRTEGIAPFRFAECVATPGEGGVLPFGNCFPSDSALLSFGTPKGRRDSLGGEEAK